MYPTLRYHPQCHFLLRRELTGPHDFSILAKSWTFPSSITIPLGIDAALHVDHLRDLLDAV